MQHRGTARRRVLIVVRDGPARPGHRDHWPTGARSAHSARRPAAGTGDRCASTGSRTRWMPAQPITRRRRRVTLAIPAWAKFAFPQRAAGAEERLMAATGPARRRAPGSACCPGRRLDLLDPSPLDIEIADIAHGLARVARWNGQTGGDHAFSVAQHSLLVEAIFRALSPAASPDAAAGGAAARRAGICDRRHDLAVQVGGRRRLQGGRGAAAAGDPSALRAAGRNRRRS